ncbi:MAG TPA: hypothetical protein VF916_01880 [Ktedonobacterales bacterium]
MEKQTRATSEKPSRCVALTKAGQPCRAFASTPDGRCMLHGPRASELHVLGGKATSNANRSLKLLPARLVPIFERLLRVFEQLDAGEYDRQQATAMASVASVLIKVVNAGELEERMRVIERMASEVSGRPGKWPYAGA